MSSKLVVVTGATGKQGGSVVDALLKNPAYSVRAVTRNPNSDASRALAARGVEVVAADLDNYDSLLKAFQGAYAVFGNTDFWNIFAEKQDAQDAHNREYERGKHLVDAVAATPSVKHFIWSTLASVDTSVPHYLIIGYYTSNLLDDPPRLEGDKYVWKETAKPNTILPSAGYVQVNCGLLVEAIVRQPVLTQRKSVAGYVPITFEETVQLWGKVVGKAVKYVQLPFDEFVKQSPAGPKFGLELALSMAYLDKHGFAGFAKPGVEIVTKEQLGVQGWVGGEDAFRRTDWSSVLA